MENTEKQEVQELEKPSDTEKGTKKKTSDKKISSSVKISLVIVLLLGIAFLAVGFGLGVFDDIEQIMGDHGFENVVQRNKTKSPSAMAFADAVFGEKTIFDCHSQTDVYIKDVLGERELSHYALADLNGDGEKELILRMKDKSNATGDADLMEILHRSKGNILGRVIPYREMQVVSELGTFKGNVETETDVYYELKIEEKSMESVEFARGTFTDSMIAEKVGDELKEVSLEEFTRFINKRFGARAVGFKEYSEEELKKDLEDPDRYDLIEVQEMGTAYWGVIIPELLQYNNLLGSSYSKFEKREGYVYSDEQKWTDEANRLLCCATGEDLQYVGTSNSIYESEYLGVRDDAIIMSGAATDVKETQVQDFILDDKDFENIPARFCVRKADGNDKGSTALVWSCGDSFLCIFVEGDTEDSVFYERPVTAVCYILKDCSSILGYPQILD